MQDLEKNTGKWQGEREQEARNEYIIGSFVSLTFRLTFFRLSNQGVSVLLSTNKGCLVVLLVGSYVCQQRVLIFMHILDYFIFYWFSVYI
jgi:hypothetical protein